MLSWLLLPQPWVSSCSVQSPSGGRAGVFLRQMNGAASSIIPDSSPSLHTSIKLSHPYCEFGDSPKSHFIAFVQKYIINLPFVGYLIKMDRDADAVKEEWKYLYLHSEGLQYLFSKQNKALLGLWQQNSLSVFTWWKPWSEWIISCLWGAGLYLCHDTFFHAFFSVGAVGNCRLSFSFVEVKQLIMNWGELEKGCILLSSGSFPELRMP